jgi:hypothetical protein
VPVYPRLPAPLKGAGARSRSIAGCHRPIVSSRAGGDDLYPHAFPDHLTIIGRYIFCCRADGSGTAGMKPPSKV